MTRAPSFWARSTGRSTEPLSTIRISSEQRRLSIARAMFRASLRVMSVAVIFIFRCLRGGLQPAGCNRRVNEAEDEDGESDPANRAAPRSEVGGIVDHRMTAAHDQQQQAPHDPAIPEFAQG